MIRGEFPDWQEVMQVSRTKPKPDQSKNRNINSNLASSQTPNIPSQDVYDIVMDSESTEKSESDISSNNHTDDEDDQYSQEMKKLESRLQTENNSSVPLNLSNRFEALHALNENGDERNKPQDDNTATSESTDNAAH